MDGAGGCRPVRAVPVGGGAGRVLDGECDARDGGVRGIGGVGASDGALEVGPVGGVVHRIGHGHRGRHDHCPERPGAGVTRQHGHRDCRSLLGDRGDARVGRGSPGRRTRKGFDTVAEHGKIGDRGPGREERRIKLEREHDRRVHGPGWGSDLHTRGQWCKPARHATGPGLDKEDRSRVRARH